MDISSDDNERTHTMIDPTNDAEASGASPDFFFQQHVNIEQGDASNSAERNQAEILHKLEVAFQQLTSTDDLQSYLALHSRMTVIVSIEKLFELSAEKCAFSGGVFM